MQDKIIEMKTGNYNNNADNFVIENELTVTITLNEYRELVSCKATKDSEIDKANKDRYKRENDIKKLTEENNSLKLELYDLQKKVEGVIVNNIKEVKVYPEEKGEATNE